MMTAEAAARSAVELLRQLRAGAAIVDHSREDSGLQAAGEGRVIFGVGQAGIDELPDNPRAVGLGEVGPVPDACAVVAQGIERFLTKRRVADLPCLSKQKLVRRLDHWRAMCKRDRRIVAFAGFGMALRHRGKSECQDEQYCDT